MRSNLIGMVGIFWIMMMAVILLADARSRPVEAMPLPAPAVQPVAPVGQPAAVLPAVEPEVAAEPVDTAPADPTRVAAPYASYTLTQGLHGYSYGHAAIDLTGGKGSTVLAPITGTVTQFFYDGLGNPTLVIENEVYQVTMMHGAYSVSIGQEVKIGQAIGIEGNLGNTVDGWGQSCRGRDCGYHTHLNIFDKRTGSNSNPIELMQ